MATSSPFPSTLQCLAGGPSAKSRNRLAQNASLKQLPSSGSEQVATLRCCWLLQLLQLPVTFQSSSACCSLGSKWYTHAANDEHRDKRPVDELRPLFPPCLQPPQRACKDLTSITSSTQAGESCTTRRAQLPRGLSSVVEEFSTAAWLQKSISEDTTKDSISMPCRATSSARTLVYFRLDMSTAELKPSTLAA
jgi:hypothetical protein